MARLAHFTKKNGNAEYVVIVIEGEPSEYCRPGYKLEVVVEIGDDKLFRMFPCDTILENTEVD